MGVAVSLTLAERARSRTVEKGANTYAETSYSYTEGVPFKVQGTVKLASTPTVEVASSWSYFDALGRELQRVWTGEGGTKWAIRSYYDSAGRQWASAGPFAVSAETYPQALPTATPYPWQATGYASNGSLQRVVRSDGATASPLPSSPETAQGPATSYSWSPRVMRVTDPDGRTTRQVSDGFGRRRHVIEVSGDELWTDYAYTLDGLLESVVDGKEVEVARAYYDPLGRRTHLVDRDLGTWEWRYDANGNVSDEIHPDGQATTYTFDALDRPSTACWWAKQVAPGEQCESAGHVFSYTWDAPQDVPGTADLGNGRVGAVTDGSVTTRRQYDALGRIVRETRAIAGLAGEFVTDLEYDVGGRLRGMVYPGPPSRFRVDYAYHPGTALLKSVTGSDTVVYATFSGYTAAGVPGTIVRPGATTTYATDPWSGLLSGIGTTNTAGARVVKLDYAFSGAGKGTKITDGVANDVRSFGYDELGRLKYATESAPQVPRSLWFWPEAQRVHALNSVATSTAGYEFTHDANGSVSSGYDVSGMAAAPPLRTFRYDTETVRGLLGMPVTITRAPGLPVDMLYDDTGMRVRKQSGASAAYYIGPHYELRRDAYSSSAAEGPEPFIYVLAGSARLAVSTSTKTLHFHHDHQGSTVAVTSNSGDVVWSGRYSPHGELARESGQRVTPYLYSGREFDEETGLYYYGARFYDPAVGRFTSPDTIVPRAFDPQALNRYAFALNDPVSLVDPDGHDPIEVCVSVYGGACNGGGGGGGPPPDYGIPDPFRVPPGGYGWGGGGGTPGTRVPTVSTSGTTPPRATLGTAGSVAPAVAVAGFGLARVTSSSNSGFGWLPRSGGIYVGAGIELGVRRGGIAYNRAFDVGVFSSGRAAAFTSLGLVSPSSSSPEEDPDDPNFVYGGGAGYGAGFWTSNASTPEQLFGKFAVWNIGIDQYYFTLAMDRTTRIFQLSGGISRFPIGGLVWSHYQTYTWPISTVP